MINLNYKIDNWWIRNIEMDIQPEKFLNNAEMEGAICVSTYLWRYIYSKCFNDGEENHVQATI